MGDGGDSHSVTRVLKAAVDGDPRAAAELLPLVYQELRTLARARMKHVSPGHTLQATDLVHEAYMRILGREDPGWDGRGHFFAAAAHAMRQILVEAARRKVAQKRGGGRRREDLDLVEPAFAPPSEDVIAVHEAMQRLEAMDPLKGQIVNLLYFAGLNADEAGAALGTSPATVRREWRFIRAWLERELTVD